MKKVYLLLIMNIVISILFVNIYRTYIFVNQIFDFHIADSLLNLIAVIVFSNIIFIVDKKDLYKNKLTECVTIISPVLGLLIYEFSQNYLNIGTFDTYDIIFTLIGGIIAYFIKISYYDNVVKR